MGLRWSLFAQHSREIQKVSDDSDAFGANLFGVVLILKFCMCVFNVFAIFCMFFGICAGFWVLLHVFVCFLACLGMLFACMLFAYFQAESFVCVIFF